MKKPSQSNIKSNPITNKLKQTKTKKYYFPNMTNQEAIKKSLKMLGVTNQIYQKQTKMSINGDLFPKNINPSTTKVFFFISRICIRHLCSNEQNQELQIWYPPRTVNQQIQFKKVFYKLIQKLETQCIIPKNIILSKVTIMGQASLNSLLEFYRILTELALRASYIQKYSKNERLIQIAISNLSVSAQNDINKFYVYPFCETATTFESPIQSSVQLQNIKKLFKLYIERYRKKILNLKLNQTDNNINPQKIMSQIVQQRQLAQTLEKKVNKSIYSQNRAFDRRIIMDKHNQIWKQLQEIKCEFIEDVDNSVLRMEGQTSKLLSNWKTSTGTHSIIQFNSFNSKLKQLKQKCDEKMKGLNELKKKVLQNIKN